MVDNKKFVKMANEKFFSDSIDGIPAIVRRKKVVADETTYSLLHIIYDMEKVTYEDLEDEVVLSEDVLIEHLEKLVNSGLIGRVPGKNKSWKGKATYEIKTLGKLEVLPNPN